MSAGFLLILAACSEAPEVPGQIRVGLLPDERRDVVLHRHRPLFAYLEKETGLSFRLDVPKSYQELNARFLAGEYDVAYFGGVSFVIAQKNTGAIPLVSRDIDKAFTSVFIARGGAERKQLKDFVGLAISFADDKSTSGHLMPRHFLKQQFIEPETFFSRVEYAASHDSVARSVLKNDVALGAMSSEIYRGMLADGRLKAGELEVVWESPAFINYVWAAHPQFSKENREKLTRAFLGLDLKHPDHESILVLLRAGEMLPADKSEFRGLEEMADAVGLLEE